jgi:hypothetical protein
VLPELAGLRLSETTAQRTTEAAGERLGEHLDRGGVLGGPTPWQWQRDAEGKTCAYISVDATGEFPGARFYLLHSLSHLLLTAISLECGYAASAFSTTA